MTIVADVMTLRQARRTRRRPLTQDQLAARSGVDQTYISRIEQGNRVPSEAIRKRLAKALRIDPAALSFPEKSSVSVVPGSDVVRSIVVGHDGSGFGI